MVTSLLIKCFIGNFLGTQAFTISLDSNECLSFDIEHNFFLNIVVFQKSSSLVKISFNKREKTLNETSKTKFYELPIAKVKHNLKQNHLYKSVQREANPLPPYNMSN